MSSPARLFFRKKLKLNEAAVLMAKNTAILFTTDRISLFDLWDLPNNSFCIKINVVTSNINSAGERFKKIGKEVSWKTSPNV